MKKFFCILVIILIVIPVFAQKSWDGNRRMAITINPFTIAYPPAFGGLGIQGGFEFALVEMASIKANVFYVRYDLGKISDNTDGSDTILSMFRLSLEGRWYPMGDYVEGFFVNGGFQFHRLSAKFDFDDAYLGIGLNTYSLYGGVGYKIVFGNSRIGFVLEPTLDFIWPVYSDIPFDKMDKSSSNILGWMMGVKLFRLGISVGVAF